MSYPRYNSGYGNTDTYQPPAPMVPGRRSAPYATLRQSSGPTGDSTTLTTPYQPPMPQQAPGMATVNVGAELPVQMPYEQLERRQNMGLSPRGPSPQFASSPLGQQRFPSAPQMGGAPMAPAMLPGAQTFGGMPGGGSPAQSRMAVVQVREGGLQHRADQAQRTKTFHSLWTNPARDQNQTPEEVMQQADKVLGLTGSPTTQPSYSGAPMSQEQPTQNLSPAPSMPYTNPQTGAPQMLQPIGNGPGEKAPRDTSNPNWRTPQEKAALETAYNTAGADLAARPALGTTPQGPRPVVPFGKPRFEETTPGDTAGARASADQTIRNQQATQRRQDGAYDQQTQKNADQFAQNQAAAKRIKFRQNQAANEGIDFNQQPAQNNTASQGLPSHALDAAQGVGGQVQGDGTMIHPSGARYAFDAKRNGWALME